MDMSVLIIISGLLVYFIVKRIEDKKKENFEDREY